MPCLQLSNYTDCMLWMNRMENPKGFREFHRKFRNKEFFFFNFHFLLGTCVIIETHEAFISTLKDYIQANKTIVVN